MLLFKGYHRRIKCNNTIAGEQRVQTWIRFSAQVHKTITIKINAQLMIYATQQSTIHFAAICRPYRSRRRRIEYVPQYNCLVRGG